MEANPPLLPDIELPSIDNNVVEKIPYAIFHQMFLPSRLVTLHAVAAKPHAIRARVSVRISKILPVVVDSAGANLIVCARNTPMQYLCHPGLCC